jgi:hypothetical protein
MTTEAQIEANRRNSKKSTGPRTGAGKSVSSVNATTLGLFTRKDHVAPDDQEFYEQFCEVAYGELKPEGFLEECSAVQIIGANWRLHLCDSAEACLTDFSEATDKTRRSIERARSHATSILNRFLTQLRKLQTERILREQIPLGRVTHVPVADHRTLLNACHTLERATQVAARNGSTERKEHLNQLINGPLPPISHSKPETSEKLASNCKDGSAASNEALVNTPEEMGENPNLPSECGIDNPPDLEIAA